MSALFNPVRRIISGKKARLVDEQAGIDLDLVKLADNLIIMGYPSTGVQSLYRNPLPSVLTYLNSLQQPYHILNLCPLRENAYDASAFSPRATERSSSSDAAPNGNDGDEKVPESRVSRFPWPDHCPPPLSLIRALVMKGKERMDRGEIVVVHCKAGKGRSGTAAISLLLYLAATPSTSLPPTTSSSTDSLPHPPPHPSSSSTTPTIDLNQTLADLLAHHSATRMKKSATSPGISISSQRRWLGYWCRLLKGEDPRIRPEALKDEEGEQESGKKVDKRRMVEIEWVEVDGGLEGTWGLFGSDFAVRVYRYKDDLGDRLRARELELIALGSEKGEHVSSEPVKAFTDEEWADSENQLQRTGVLSCHSQTHDAAGKTHKTHHLLPSKTYSLTHRPSTTTSSTSLASTPVVLSPTDSPAAAGTPPATTPSPTGSSASSFVEASPPSSFDENIQRTQADDGEVERKRIVVDGDREVQFRLLVGKHGKKHGKLGMMAALGIIWLIPSFHSSPPSPTASSADPNAKDPEPKLHVPSEIVTQEKGNGRFVVTVRKEDVDFRKPQARLKEVRIGMRWV
ncbi:phosphatidylinositol-3,4,5-trisphosphate 3-phosphatase [Pseudohyphozyma bogoriensis]|nr:phosphatidylinositol-3,4,5-trisphosphate 3-phosphatase [Pseudohyphozyma bogoriensis]